MSIGQELIAEAAPNLTVLRQTGKPNYLVWVAAVDIAAGDELIWLGPQFAHNVKKLGRGLGN